MIKLTAAFGVSTMLVFAAFAAGCGEEPVKEFSDQGVQVEVAAGREFALSIESNPTTGYQWQLDGTPEKSILEFKKSVYQPPDKSAPGAPGREILTFKAKGRGEAAVALKYVRAWEDKTIPPKKTAVFLVVVK